MARTKAPIPKNQEEISQEAITPYTNAGKVPTADRQKRALQKRVDDTNAKPLTIGLKDIDETIVYYFNEVIKPSVIQNTNRLNVPILYGSPERWASVQKDGFYRDKNGKIMTPLIMFKRDSVEKNRSLGTKIDANNPINYGVFNNKYTKKNYYDAFSVLTNREPVKEYFGVIIPDYVNITYSCVIFTDYVEQMNKIVESINYASDSYWGDPERFKFRAMIDNYVTAVELNKGQDRAVKTSFSINLFGHIIPDSINASIKGTERFYSKSRVNFLLESSGDVETLNARAGTSARVGSRRFFDTALTNAQATATAGLTSEEIVYLSTANSATADLVTLNQATFSNRSFLTPPSGFVIGQDEFTVYVNGVVILEAHRTVSEVGSDIRVTFNEGLIGYAVTASDTVILTGKFS